VSTTSFEQLLTRLTQGLVEYVLIGGVAAAIHGSAYVTYDFDVWYDRSMENVERLARALAPVHPTLREAPRELPFRLDAATIRAGLNFTLDTDLGPLDLFGEVAPFGQFSQVINHSEMMELFGLQVRVLSLESLIQAKQTAGRRKDLLVIPELLALLELRKRPPA
jgi:predicted nucleotidyltransferase